VLIDDSQEFLGAATRLLEAQGVTVLGCGSSRAQALELAATKAPDVALVDIELGEEDGVELAAELAGGQPARRVILISGHEQEDLPELVNGSGAVGFLAKSALGADAIAALL
jgi:DNA-binding NarL/FixJ family response regulator